MQSGRVAMRSNQFSSVTPVCGFYPGGVASGQLKGVDGWAKRGHGSKTNF
jgi:hypothetical protein